MKRSAFILLLLAGFTAAPLAAQKNRPTTTGPDADRDGVADASDRCPSTLQGTRVGRDGCPLTMAPAAPQGAAPATAARPDSAARTQAPGKGRAAPTLLGAPSQRRDSAAAPAGGNAGNAGNAAAAPTQPVSQPNAAGAGQAAAPPDPVVTPQGAAGTQPGAPPVAAFSAGMAAPPFSGSSLADATTYARRIAPLLDSSIVLLVNVFRNTSGQPIMGAGDPSALSQREKDRWTRCRNLYWDLTSYRVNFGAAVEQFEAAPAAVLAAAVALDSALGDALADTAAVAECDNVSSMIAGPARWSPWQQQYQAAARRFYAGWYAAIRNVHDRQRAFVIALNATLPAGQRIPVPPALQRNAPYAGAGPGD